MAIGDFTEHATVIDWDGRVLRQGRLKVARTTPVKVSCGGEMRGTPCGNLLGASGCTRNSFVLDCNDKGQGRSRAKRRCKDSHAHPTEDGSEPARDRSAPA